MSGYRGEPVRASSVSLALALAALGMQSGDAAGQSPAPTPDPEVLVGSWMVDLRPSPDAPEYLQEFLVTGTADGRLEGMFYGSVIERGRINVDWGLVRFAFITRDNSGVYHTSGVLEGGRLEGTTHSLGRDFLSVWTAERTPDPLFD